MKNAVLGVLIGAGLMATAASWPGPVERVYAGPSSSTTGPGNMLITLSSPVGEDGERLTVIDPVIRVMGVYHIARESGEITLKSVRNFYWDLQMLEFNSVRPKPQEIRSMLEQK